MTEKMLTINDLYGDLPKECRVCPELFCEIFNPKRCDKFKSNRKKIYVKNDWKPVKPKVQILQGGSPGLGKNRRV